METINLTPTWEAAVRIYCAVLENPDAREEAKEAAREDIIKLARSVDSHQSEGE